MAAAFGTGDNHLLVATVGSPSVQLVSIASVLTEGADQCLSASRMRMDRAIYWTFVITSTSSHIILLLSNAQETQGHGLNTLQLPLFSGGVAQSTFPLRKTLRYPCCFRTSIFMHHRLLQFRWQSVLSVTAPWWPHWDGRGSGWACFLSPPLELLFRFGVPLFQVHHIGLSATSYPSNRVRHSN